MKNMLSYNICSIISRKYMVWTWNDKPGFTMVQYIYIIYWKIVTFSYSVSLNVTFKYVEPGLVYWYEQNWSKLFDGNIPSAPCSIIS